MSNRINEEILLINIVKEFINTRLNRHDYIFRAKYGLTTPEIVYLIKQILKHNNKNLNINDIINYLLFVETKNMLIDNYTNITDANKTIITSKFIPMPIILEQINNNTFNVYIDKFYYGKVVICNNNNIFYVSFDKEYKCIPIDCFLIYDLFDMVNIVVENFLNKIK